MRGEEKEKGTNESLNEGGTGGVDGHLRFT